VHRFTLGSRVVLLALLTLSVVYSIAEEKATAAVPADPPAFKPDSGAIFAGARAVELLKQCSRPSLATEGTWTPNPEQIRELERRLRFELAKTLEASLLATKASVSDYYRQYGGVVVSGRRVIYINGFHHRFLEDTRDWRATPVSVCDGGEQFWHAAYDPAHRTFVVFQFAGASERTIVFNGRV
jgi:hypothetical protein